MSWGLWRRLEIILQDKLIMYKTKQSPHDSWSGLSLYIVLIVYDHFERDWNDCCSCKSNSVVLPGNLSYCSWKAHEHICKCVFFIKRIKPFDVSWNRNEGGHHLRHVVRSFLRMDTSSSIVPYLTYVTYLFKPEPQSSPQPFFVHCFYRVWQQRSPDFVLSCVTKIGVPFKHHLMRPR